MEISLFYRMIAYDIILIVSLIVAGYAAGIKIYGLTVLFFLIASLVHMRLTRMLELGEEETWLTKSLKDLEKS